MRAFAHQPKAAKQAAPDQLTILTRARVRQPHAGVSATEPPRTGHEFSRIPIFHPAGGTVQAKLAITQPGDSYEQDAERAAEQVLRMAQPATRRLAYGAGGAGELTSDITRHLGAGAPLDSASRSYFEPRFAHDFGAVRIHNGPQAASAAASIQARAFTLGRDVVFAAGSYAPGSASGRRLLAHELAHVVQQSGADGVHVGAEHGWSPVSARPVRTGAPAMVYRAGPEPAPAPAPAPPAPAFAGVGNEAGAAGARTAAASIAGLISGAAAVRALETIPIIDPEQKKIVIQHVLNSPAVLRARAEQGRVRSLSQQEFEEGQQTLGFPGGASAFADAANDFIYITPFGSPTAFTLGHEVSHIQTGPVVGGGADPELALALGNLNTEVRAAFVDYALVQLKTMQDELAAGKTEDQAVAGFAQRYSKSIFDYIAKGHGSVAKTLGELAAIVSARRGTSSVPTNFAELKKALAKGFVTEADLALIFSPEVNIFNVEEPFEMEGP